MQIFAYLFYFFKLVLLLSEMEINVLLPSKDKKVIVGSNSVSYLILAAKPHCAGFFYSENEDIGFCFFSFDRTLFVVIKGIGKKKRFVELAGFGRGPYFRRHCKLQVRCNFD